MKNLVELYEGILDVDMEDDSVIAGEILKTGMHVNSYCIEGGLICVNVNGDALLDGDMIEQLKQMGCKGITLQNCTELEIWANQISNFSIVSPSSRIIRFTGPSSSRTRQIILDHVIISNGARPCGLTQIELPEGNRGKKCDVKIWNSSLCTTELVLNNTNKLSVKKSKFVGYRIKLVDFADVMRRKVNKLELGEYGKDEVTMPHISKYENNFNPEDPLDVLGLKGFSADNLQKVLIAFDDSCDLGSLLYRPRKEAIITYPVRDCGLIDYSGDWFGTMSSDIHYER